MYGAVAGVEPQIEYDKQGRPMLKGVGFSPEKALLGIAGITIAKKAGLLGKGLVKEAKELLKSKNFDDNLLFALNELKQFAKKYSNPQEFEQAINKGEFSTNVIFKKVREIFPNWTFDEQSKFTNRLTGRMLVQKANAEVGSKSITDFKFNDFWNEANKVKTFQKEARKYKSAEDITNIAKVVNSTI